MKTPLVFALLVVAGAGQVCGQTITQSSCASSATRGADIINKSQQAISWRLTFWYTGFTAVTMEIDGAPDNGSGGAGAYVAMSNAIDGTTNPVTVNASPQAGTVAVKSYASHVSVFPSSVTGSGQVCWLITGLAGASTSPNVVVTSAGGGTQDVNLVKVQGTPINLGQAAMAASLPVVVASNQTPVEVAGTTGTAFANDLQGNAYTFSGCNLVAEVALSGTAYTQIIAPSGSTIIRPCKVFVTSASGGAPVVNTFTLAFGSNCAVAPTEKLNAAAVTGLDLDFNGALRSTVGDALCIKESVANSDKVTVTYAQAVF